jgi:hypothetical protein
MENSKYNAIKTEQECNVLIETTAKERLESEQKRIGFTLQLMRQSSGKNSLQADIADAQSRLASAETEKTQHPEGSPEWKAAEARRRKADSDFYSLSLEAEETLESVQVKIGHQLEVVEAILALKDDHLAKLNARKAAILAGN